MSTPVEPIVVCRCERGPSPLVGAIMDMATGDPCCPQCGKPYGGFMGKGLGVHLQNIQNAIHRATMVGR